MDHFRNDTGPQTGVCIAMHSEEAAGGRFSALIIMNGMEYSIDPIGADPVYKRYTDGTCLKQFQFAFTSKEAYDGDARTGIANSGFYQAFEEWVESNNMNDILPELDGHDATRVDVLQSGYLFSAEADLGRYQMICRVIYR